MKLEPYKYIYAKHPSCQEEVATFLKKPTLAFLARSMLISAELWQNGHEGALLFSNVNFYSALTHGRKLDISSWIFYQSIYHIKGSSMKKKLHA